MGRNAKSRRSKAPKSGRFSANEDLAYAQSQARRTREQREAERQWAWMEAEREWAQRKADAEREAQQREAERLRQWMREEPDGELEILWNEDAVSYYWAWSHPFAYSEDRPELMLMCRHFVEPVLFSHPLMSIWWSWAKLQAVWYWLWPKLQRTTRAFLALSSTARFLVAALLLALMRVSIYVAMHV